MEKIGNRNAFVLFLFFFLSSLGAAADVKVEAIVDRNRIAQGDTITLTVEVSSSETVSVREPRIPDLKSFELLNSWTSSSMSSRLVQTGSGMKFNTVRKKLYNYSLAPTKKGKLKIGPFEVVVEGKSYKTKTIDIAVLKGGSRPSRPQRRRGRQDPFDRLFDDADDVFSQLLNRKPLKGQRTLPQNPDEAFFVQVDVDKTEAYAGEQINAKWYLYVRGALQHIDRLKFPTLQGFWKEDVEAAPALSFTQEVVNGVPYKKALLASYALFPIKEGQAIIDPYTVKCRIAFGGSGFFNMGKAYNYTKSSEKIVINVKPLPEEGKPDDFSGAVGKFNVAARVEGREFPVNQPFAFKIRFQGRGNAKLIDLPKFDFGPNVQLYDTRKEAKFFPSGKSYKEFELLLIPRQEGELTIPALDVSIFDPELKRYVRKSTQAVTLNFSPSENAPSIPSSQLAQTETPVEEESSGFPPILISWSEGSQMSSVQTVGVWGGLYIALFGLLFLKGRHELGWFQEKKNLKEKVQKRLKKLHQISAKKDWRMVGKEGTNLIYFVLGEVSGQGGASEEFNKLMSLAPPSVRRELSEPFQKSLSSFEILSFAPEEVVGSLKEKAKMNELIKELESLSMKAVKFSDET